MKYRKRILAGVLCCALLTIGCDVGENEEKEPQTVTPVEESSEQNKLNALQPHAYGNVQGLQVEPGKSISIIGRGEKSSYWATVKKGAQDAVDAINQNLGYKGKDKLVLNYSAPETENDVDGQVNILDEELARYPIAVGIALADASASQVQFDLAWDNGIPIVAFDSGTEHKNVVCMVDTDNIEAASTAARKLCDMLNGSGKILVFAHDSSSTSAEEREKGFVDTINEEYPGIEIAMTCHLDELEEMKTQIATERIQSGEPEEDEEAAILELADSLSEQDVIQYILEKNPDAKGIFVTAEHVADYVLDVTEDMEWSDEYKMVSFDGGKTQLERLEEGKLDGLIVQNPYGIGYATVVACIRATMNEGNEAVVDTGYTWVEVKNMNEESIQKMMY